MCTGNTGTLQAWQGGIGVTLFSGVCRMLLLLFLMAKTSVGEMVLSWSLNLRLMARVVLSREGVACQPHCAFNDAERHQEQSGK